MVTRCALVVDGTVFNVVLVDSDADWTPPEGATLVVLDEETVSPGDTYNGRTFTAGPVDPLTTTVQVEVDPAQLTGLLAQAQKATSVAQTRTVLAALIQQLTPNG